MEVILTSQIKKKGNCVMKCYISFLKLKIILRKSRIFLKVINNIKRYEEYINQVNQGVNHLKKRTMKNQLFCLKKPLIYQNMRVKKF